MTAVMDPPTEEATDLATDRWEVRTSLPMAITAPPAIDFVITSYAEQVEGDFPAELSNPEGLFDQLREYVQREMGVTNISSGILFRDGDPVAGYLDNRPLQSETGPQALRSLVSSFAIQSSGIVRTAQRALIEDQIEQFPLPVFGSPPSGWETVAQSVGSGSAAIFAGYSVTIGQPVIAIIGGVAAFLIWFFKPLAKAARRNFTERAVGWFGGTTEPDDFS